MKSKKIILFLVPMFWGLFAHGMEDPYVDSLLHVFHKGSLEEGLPTANELAWELRYVSMDTALGYAQWAYVNYQKIGDIEGMATSLKRKGVVMKNMGSFSGAIESYREALGLERATKDMKGVASCYNNMGSIYKRIGALDEAHRCFMESLIIKEKIMKGSYSLCNTYRNLGNFYADHRFELDTALDYLKKAEVIAVSLNKKSALADIENDKGRIHEMKGDLDSAEGHMLKALEFHRSRKDRNGEANVLLNLGLVMTKKRIAETSENYLKESLGLYTTMGDTIGIALCLVNLGNLELSKKEYRNAVDYFQGSLSITEVKSMANSSKEALLGLAEGYAGAGDLKKAYDYMRRYDILEDTLYNNERNKTIAHLRERYNTEKKEQEIAYLTTIHDQQAMALEQSKKIRNSIMLVSILVVIIVGLVAVYYRERQRSEKRDAIKNEEIHFLRMQELLNNEERHVFEAAMDAQEEERKRIASMLHGEVGGILHMVRMYFSSLDEKISQKMEAEREQYEKANELLGKVTKEIREVSHSLDAGIVSNVGLLAALEELATSIERSGKMKVDINAFDMDKRFAVERELGVYRAIQEAVGNVLKHSGASKLQLTLTRDTGSKEDELTIIIEDNGKGFDLVKVRKGNGLGLRNIERLVKKLNGEVVFDSTPGKGATIIIKLKI